MPLTAESPTRLHVLQNLLLITLCILAIPLSTAILFISLVINSSKSLQTLHHKKNKNKNKHQPQSLACLAPKTILVTGVGMSKGLFIARAFHAAGHTVIGADFEPHSLPVSGRFSKSLKSFYRLPSPPPPPVSNPPQAPPQDQKEKENLYTQKLLEIVNSEQVDLWISCSGVMSALQDGDAAETVERDTKCVALQFNRQLTQTLHEKHSFIAHTLALHLPVPATHLVTSVSDALAVLDSQEKTTPTQRYVLKSVGVEDAVRADMTLLPLSSRAATRTHLEGARIAPGRPFVLQRFVGGREYCTHAVVVRGRVVGFTACGSAELLMHYEPLGPGDGSGVFEALLGYTETYVERMAGNNGHMTGHFSVDFLVDECEGMGQEKGKGKGKEKVLEKRLFPIECNPRAHTAVVNFGNDGQGMVDAYLGAISHSWNDTVFVSTSTTRHYWIGHDVVTRLFLPMLTLVFTGKGDWGYVFAKWREFAEHVVYWRDPTYEVWDPLPAWWMYSVYWPCMFLIAVVRGEWWSRCNVSTGKVFRC